MIRHVVLWKLKEEALGMNRDQLAAELARRFEALVGPVPGILTLEVGRNVVAGDTASDFCLVATFEDLAGLKAYAAHPAHQAVLAFLGQVVSERRAADYEVRA